MRALTAVALAGLLASCSLASEQAKPPLFVVRDGDTTIWLLGSMHVLPPRTDWRDDAVTRAIDQADTLVLESDPDAEGGFDAIAKAPGLPPLDKRVAPDRREALAKAIRRTGQAADAFDGYKDWAAAVMLSTGDALDAGATAKDGVDAQLWDAFRGRKRVALEAPGDQLRALDILPPQLQQRMLEEALSEPDYETVEDAWARGDLSAFNKAGPSKELRPFLVTAANRRWADWVVERMGQPGKVLVAVGAGHLAGKDSLVDLLEARGFRVERVQ
ncbi:TraB/GumN family protein [Sphingomonas sp.]|uniref:TraB/GumN family protein n=1 Tax=Sphingomonas sp. TaxID=28214 RepID=UPI002E33082E|nr:TraB/GumN family protein [Sphingomonas sp.]HEX4692994.1 TraB/GumN family protein [Sphingomonas sp.]